MNDMGTLLLMLLILCVELGGTLADDRYTSENIFLGTEDVQQQPDSILQDNAAVSRRIPFKLTGTNLNIPQEVMKNGYPAEMHEVKTEDGYFITLHRIPHGKTKPAQLSRNVVVLFRALFSSTYEFLLLGPEKAIGYNLADMGYDVWMVEQRGNSFSQSHVKLSPSTPNFWDMSWDDMGRYDVPAAISHVLNNTGVDKVFVGGHSMGTTSLFVGLSVHPWLNEKIRLMIALAPVAFLEHVTGPIGMLGRLVPAMTWDLIPLKPLLPVHTIDVLSVFGKTICSIKLLQILCTKVMYLIEKISFGIFNISALPDMMKHFPESDSTKTVAHFMQSMRSGKFQRFDHGLFRNLERYGRATPEEYDLSRITAPVALFISEADIFANPKDCMTLNSKLPNVAALQVTKDRSFSHMDFVAAEHAPEQVYQYMYNIMQQY